jgi:hypothetical protein
LSGRHDPLEQGLPRLAASRRLPLAHVEDEGAAPRQRPREGPERFATRAIFDEVVQDAAAEDGLIGGRRRQRAEVGVDEGDRVGTGLLARHREELGGGVQAGDHEAAAGELDGIATGPAPGVEELRRGGYPAAGECGRDLGALGGDGARVEQVVRRGEAAVEGTPARPRH